MTAAATAPVRVLYIGGCTRSGSTLVDRAIGELPGFVSTGELALVTEQGVQENRLCGCGKRFLDCPFWSSVGEQAFGSWFAEEAQELTRLHPQVTRHRHLPLTLLPALSREFAKKLDRYAELVGRLYRAVQAVSGADVVVDSTKAPAYAYVLRRVPDVDLKVLHLVRDSRGTAYSATKRLLVKDSVDRPVYKDTYSPVVITLRWVLYHALFEALKLLDGPQVLLRYEDFVRDPAGAIRRVAAFLGVPVADSAFGFVRPDCLRLGVSHTTAGNDMRFDAGSVPLREDDQWRRSLRSRQRRLVTLMSWPLLRLWRYV